MGSSNFHINLRVRYILGNNRIWRDFRGIIEYVHVIQVDTMFEDVSIIHSLIK